jgi:hypothetical protein
MTGERIHKLKTLHDYWEAVRLGAKTFEVRRDDRGFQRGDTVILEKLAEKEPHHYDYDGHDITAKPKALTFRIGWILTGGQFGIQPGYVVFSLEPIG